MWIKNLRYLLFNVEICEVADNPEPCVENNVLKINVKSKDGKVYKVPVSALDSPSEAADNMVENLVERLSEVNWPKVEIRKVLRNYGIIK